MDSLNRLAAIADANGGIITNKTAEAEGIPRTLLARQCQAGKLLRISQGQYILPEALQDELFSLSLRSGNLLFSHETALWLHGISDRTPFIHSITAPTGKLPSKAIRESCKVYCIQPELFPLGQTKLNTPAGNIVPVYDLERSICDCVRSRSRLGTETFLAAMKAYAARKDKDLHRLYIYSEKMHITGPLRVYLEVLL